MSSPRVVSLIASSTELVHALGAGDTHVARSHECDFPESVLALPAITRPKFKVEGSSLEIDKAVKALVEKGLAVYEVDADALKALNPDVIITQDQCEVCAVSLADVERAVCTWTDSKAQILSLKPHTLADIYSDIRRVATALNRVSEGEALITSMQSRIKASGAAAEGQPKPRLAFIEWIDPPMSGGHWMPELTEAAGGINLFGEHGANSPWITWDQVAAADPDAILVAPCGYDLKQTEEEMRPLREHTLFQSLRAVREHRVYLADGNAFFNRPGPRLAETAEIMAEVLHPGLCRFGHEGKAFVRWSA